MKNVGKARQVMWGIMSGAAARTGKLKKNIKERL